jgi:hypothetical protein
MGYLFVLLGVALIEPKLWENTLLVIIFFSLHHAINKSALFFLAGEILKHGLHKHYIFLGVIFASSLVGFIFTSGETAKVMLMKILESFPLLSMLLAPSILITMVLMLKFFWLSKKVTRSSTINKQILFILYSLALISLLLFSIPIGFI